ncbi:MAG: hypothetical protein DRJ31_09430 [Candidatus Methanomethylicota archaeon]|uniref:Type II toxin-antitoxin system RelE/ParE family toxin n=1 Tax=Thermoproteota archaeon TaxID=2056631 RepID=A0A497EK86_9CREN|nr:MAG: hypothetical protein DRJ31_09430 [Candidatus Verstraetearchaeota archaeon]
MEWTIVVTERFERYIRGIERKIAIRIIREIDVLKENPFKGKLLKGLVVRIGDNVFRVYSLRVGDYRVIYTVNPLEKKVYLLLVGHRDWIYKETERLLRG